MKKRKKKCNKLVNLLHFFFFFSYFIFRALFFVLYLSIITFSTLINCIAFRVSIRLSLAYGHTNCVFKEKELIKQANYGRGLLPRLWLMCAFFWLVCLCMSHICELCVCPSPTIRICKHMSLFFMHIMSVRVCVWQASKLSGGCSIWQQTAR